MIKRFGGNKHGNNIMVESGMTVFKELRKCQKVFCEDVILKLQPQRAGRSQEEGGQYMPWAEGLGKVRKGGEASVAQGWRPEQGGGEEVRQDLGGNSKDFGFLFQVQ